MSTLERFWLTYCACAMAAVAWSAWPLEAHGPGFRPLEFFALHGVIAALQFLPPMLQRGGRLRTARWSRAVLAMFGLPIVFSALGLVLPHAHPAAWESAWLAFDHLTFGAEPTAGMRLLQPEFVLASLQAIYASFYVLPVLACVLVWRQRGGDEFDRALSEVTGGFLLSYLGYLWFPTLGPKDVVPLPVAPGGEWLASLHALLHEAEANHWDCFPSGHAMMSLVAAMVASKRGCRGAGMLLVLALAIVASTLILRYHWTLDVAVGALLAVAWMRLAGQAMRCDSA